MDSFRVRKSVILRSTALKELMGHRRTNHHYRVSVPSSSNCIEMRI